MISAAVLVVVVAAGSLFAWRASLSPLELWGGETQCSASPTSDAGQLFGLAVSTDLHGASRITIQRVDTVTSTGAAAPSYWVVPVTDGSDGTGVASTDAPPPHWDQRVPAAGAAFRADDPADLVVELHPRQGQATLTGLRVVYRTADGFVHTAAIDPEIEVGTGGTCRPLGAGQRIRAAHPGSARLSRGSRHHRAVGRPTARGSTYRARRSGYRVRATRSDRR